ncbi:FadR/GntR family transcriptional regulator [Agrobacterium vaccinii]|uniref:FadR/GntR family transcriptional regulator n=1 Tax=Agrobacterium vaccinii TaxID=2735528 RepID=UPI001E563258|nr:FadR/GntR family transcriptional regulator [Agrobacterium vaccinii]UHS58823.1 FadR family transcriptional regulator [Agrobacterium vaccinii]
MGLEAGIARKGLADIVFERMLRAIKSGAYKADERLPTEHELAAEFEVSRPVIREALKRLRDQGLIYSRRGAGSFVRSMGLRQPLGFGQLENVADLLNCYEFRLTLEPAAAAAAATRHDADSLKAIRQALELLRDATNRQSHREDADFQFHLAIARAAQNTYFSTAMEALKDHIAVGMKFHGASIRREATGLTRVFAEHEAIAKAIADRHEDDARKLMFEHLQGSRGRLFQASQ